MIKFVRIRAHTTTWFTIFSEIFISHSACTQEILYEDFHYSKLLQIKGWTEDECRSDYERNRYTHEMTILSTFIKRNDK